MTLLFNRDWSVTATQPGIVTNTRTWAKPLDIDFDIEKTRDQGINEGKLTLFNLKKESRDFLAQKGTIVEIKAGYVETGAKSIFTGEVELCSPERQGNDWQIKLELRDGAAICRTVKADKSFKKDTPNQDVFNYLIGLLTTAPNDNVTPLSKGVINIASVTGTLAKGKSLRDLAYEELHTLCRSWGLELRITDFRLNIHPKNTNLLQELAVLNAKSGLIGSPEVTEDGISVECLMRDDLEPGAVFELQAETRSISGRYQVDNMSYQGTSDGGKWALKIDAVRFDG